MPRHGRASAKRSTTTPAAHNTPAHPFRLYRQSTPHPDPGPNPDPQHITRLYRLSFAHRVIDDVQQFQSDDAEMWRDALETYQSPNK